MVSAYLQSTLTQLEMLLLLQSLENPKSVADATTAYKSNNQNVAQLSDHLSYYNSWVFLLILY